MLSLSMIYSGALEGIDGYIVQVEVDLSNGLPNFRIVGLPDSAIKESQERVRTAIKNSGFAFPTKHITINLAPADTKKEGASFDLPIAIGILASSGVLPYDFEDSFIAGELSLDGSVRPIHGVLSMVHCAKLHGLKKCFIPFDNKDEASLISDIEIYPVRHLKELIAHLLNQAQIQPHTIDIQSLFESDTLLHTLDFSHVKGQEQGKRAIEIAASGAHNFLMIGPPGSGKTMLATRLPSIMPNLTFEESLEITKIYSVSGALSNKNTLITQRPFRSPHHTISATALTGGGRIPKPGEISLSHHGILFLDELPEFKRSALEIMRQPLEDKKVTISRVNASITFPSDFMLITAMNPCPCGYLGSETQCSCSPADITKYHKKISGPLLDRVDIMVEMPAVSYESLKQDQPSESSKVIRERVLKAQEIQANRYKHLNILFNSQLNSSQIDEFCPLDKEAHQHLKDSFERMNLSARAYHKILKVARTIADLNAEEHISSRHILEAIHYRSLDRKYLF